MEYNFEWDNEKAKQNYIKHKVFFSEAASVFQDPLAITIFDEKHSESEDRWLTVGISANGKCYVVSHTFVRISNKNSIIRIISAGKATKKEQKQYMEN